MACRGGVNFRLGNNLSPNIFVSGHHMSGFDKKPDM
jgi:hypothetical protein